MKIKLLIITLIFAGYANAQLPSYLWAKNAGGNAMDDGKSVATDANGNIIVTGHFGSPSITFGMITLTNPSNLGYSDFFLVKYDANGNVLWAKNAGGIPNDYGYGIATDASGNIIVTGTFSSPTITFGGITLTNPSPFTEIFIVKYDPNGNVLWAKSAGGTLYEEGISVATDAGGNVIATGYFSSSTISFGTTTLTNVGNWDTYLVKYDAGGNVLWAKNEGGSINDYCNSVATDANGNILLTGSFSSPTISFGATTFTLTSTGNDDFFLVKYDAGGNVLWAKSAVGSAYETGRSVVTDASGNVLVTGDFISPTITFGATTLTNAATSNFFLVKYDSNGNIIWAKNEGGSANACCHDLTSDPSGNIIITGYFTSPSITFGQTTFTNTGVSDMFVVKYDSGGNLSWAKKAGGNSDDEGNSVATDANGNIFITGFFTSSAIIFGLTTLTQSGGLDFFLAKLSDATTTGLEETNFTRPIDVFPNPNKGDFQLTAFDLRAEVSFILCNTLGQVVFKQSVLSGETQIKAEVSAGMYYYSIVRQDGVIAQGKVVIE